MRRAVATIAGTLAGAAMLIGAKLGTHPAGAVAADPGVDPSPVSAPTASPQAAAPRTAATPAASRTARPAHTKAAGLKDGSFTGTGASERYGTIAVSITVSGGRLTDASATCSGCGGTSRAISGNAFPTLRQEALTAQSARIAAVSGATYTSGAYRASLQSALDAAKA